MLFWVGVMLEAIDLSFSVKRRLLVEAVSLRVESGEFVAVVGPNGAGKSTLLRLLSGELVPNKGDVKVMKRPLADWSPQHLAQRRAVLSQSVKLSFAFSVLEVVLMGRIPHSNGRETGGDLEIAHMALKAVGLLSLAQRSYLTLSGGEQQRVQMARVLAQIWHKPAGGNRYLLLDEPTNNLDLAYQHSMLRLARQFAHNETTVLAILHDLNLASQYADKIIMMKNGRFAFIGSPQQTITPEQVYDVFEVPVQVILHPQKSFPLILPMA